MTALIATGIDGLDKIFFGGVPEGSVMLVQGHAGAGKTTLGLQFLMEGIRQGETCLLISVAQTEREVRHMAESHDIDITQLHREFINPGEEDEPAQYAVATQEEDLDDILDRIHAAVKKVKPDRLVLDSLLEMNLLAQSDYDYRRDVVRLKRQLVDIGTTAMIIDHVGEQRDPRIEGLMHGAILLDSLTPQIGTTYRRLMIGKFRGHDFIEGWHDFDIAKGGLNIYARMVHNPRDLRHVGETIGTGIDELDVMLGGGLEEATVTLIAGQSGTGKSTLSSLFASSAAAKGKNAGLFLFEERPEIYRDRSRGLGIDLSGEEGGGRIVIEHFAPNEVSVGHFTQTILDRIEADDLDLVVVDSLSGFVSVLTERQHLIPQFQAFLQQLARKNLLVIFTMTQHGLLGEAAQTEIDVSFLADSVILLRHSPEGSEIRRTIAVVKKRHSDHERRIRNFVISPGQVTVEDIDEGEKRQIERRS